MQINIKRENGFVSIEAPYSPSNNDQYRSRGGKFSRETGWKFSASPAIDKLIDELYGSSLDTVVVEIQYTDALLARRDNILQLGGYVLAERRGRDSAVTFPDGVVIYSGHFERYGGSVKNPRIGEPVEPVTFHVRVRADFAVRHQLKVVEAKVEPTTSSPETQMLNALQVIALSPRIREWLAANDPKALEQVEQAIEAK